MENNTIIALAATHGLRLHEELTFNEMGVDFRVAFANDLNGQKWVLRIPRRTGLAVQINREASILNLVNAHLSVAVPDWQIATPELVAYPLLADKPAITYDPVSYAVTWNIPQDGSAFTNSLAKVLVQLHRIPKRAGGRVWPHMHEHIVARQSAAPLAYAHFALTNDLPTHIEAAKAQLAAL